MITIAQLLKHDFKKGSFRLYDSNGNQIYREDSNGYWSKYEYDTNGNLIYCETSTRYIEDKRPKTNSDGSKRI